MIKIKFIAVKIIDWFKTNKRTVYLEYACLSLFILFPLIIKSGFIFAPDMVFTPKLRFPGEANSYFLIQIFLWFANFILYSWLIRKIIIFLILWLAGVGMHKLAPATNKWARYFAGIFYMFNPFVYSRFMYGQILLILAYALMPFAIKEVLNFFRKANFKNAFKLVGWIILIGIIDFRSVFFIGAFLLIGFIFYFFKNIREFKKSGNIFLKLTLVGVIVFAFNSYWIIPSLLGQTSLSQSVAGIDWQQEWAFRTTADGKWGLFFNAAAMYGFWGDAQNRYFSNKEYAPYWPYLFMVLFGLVVWGIVSSFISYFKEKRKSKILNLKSEILNPNNLKNLNNSNNPDSSTLNAKPYTLYALIFIIVGIVSYALAIGVGAWCDSSVGCEVACCNSISLPSWLLPFRIFVGQALYHLTDFLNTYVPFYKGFREPQKFIGLLILCYCYLGALGVDSILRKLQATSYKLQAKGRLNAIRHTLYAKLIPAIFLLLPILYAPGLLWGFRGQLFSSQYPAAWFEVNKVLNQDEDLAGRKWSGFTEGGKTLFLPWHQYLALSFAGNKVIANPAPNFFDTEIISSDNMQMPGVLTTSNRPFSVFFENEIYPKMNEIKNLGELLAPWDVKYVMWAGESDFFNYLFVLKQKDLELVYKSERLLLFRNTAWSPKQ